MKPSSSSDGGRYSPTATARCHASRVMMWNNTARKAYAESAGRLRVSQDDRSDLHAHSTSYARHAGGNSGGQTKEVPMLTKVKLALVLCGLVAGGAGLAAA